MGKKNNGVVHCKFIHFNSHTAKITGLFQAAKFVLRTKLFRKEK